MEKVTYVVKGNPYVNPLLLHIPLVNLRHRVLVLAHDNGRLVDPEDENFLETH